MWLLMEIRGFKIPIPTHTCDALTSYSDPNPLRSRGREGRG